MKRIGILKQDVEEVNGNNQFVIMHKEGTKGIILGDFYPSTVLIKLEGAPYPLYMSSDVLIIQEISDSLESIWYNFFVGNINLAHVNTWSSSQTFGGCSLEQTWYGAPK